MMRAYRSACENDPALEGYAVVLFREDDSSVGMLTVLREGIEPLIARAKVEVASGDGRIESVDLGGEVPR